MGLLGRIGAWLGWRPRATAISISDPALARLLHVGPPSYAGVDVTDETVLGLSGVWRALQVLATIGTLPLRTLRDTGDGMRQQMQSWADDPGRVVGLTPIAWKTLVVAHMALGGDAFLRHVYGGAGQILGCEPIHPGCISVEWGTPDDMPEHGLKWYTYTRRDGTRVRLDESDMTQVMGFSVDGLRGVSVITAARHSLGTALAGDYSAARMYSVGALNRGVLVPDEESDLSPEEARTLRDDLRPSLEGWENNATVPVVSRKLKFIDWGMSSKDAQWLESRQFSIREIARWFGIPPHLLMETSAASNWGTGIEQQNLGLSRFNLTQWTCRIEQAVSRLFPRPRWVEFDFAGLEKGSAADEIDLLIKQVAAGLLTRDEARAIRNLPPLDKPQTPAAGGVTPQPAAGPAAPLGVVA